MLLECLLQDEFLSAYAKNAASTVKGLGSNVVGGSAITPASAARNCAVDRRIAEPVGVTDVGVQ